MLNSIAIAFSLFAFYLQKLAVFLIPPHNLDSFFGWKQNESAYFKHMIFGLKTVGNDMCAKGYHFYSFEFVSYFPTDVVYAEFKAVGAV